MSEEALNVRVEDSVQKAGGGEPSGQASADAAQWPRLDVPASVQLLQSNPTSGLASAEVTARQEQYGENALLDRGGRSLWSLLWDQMASTLVVVLLIAAGVSAVVGSIKDAIAILAIVILNAALGFFQEYRAERAMAALRKLAVPKVRVRREGSVIEVASSELVPGDIVLLEAGNLVPADGRITESASLRIQEAVLTGESEAIEKQSSAISGDGALALGDQKNMAFMGTSVAYGRGLMMVTATGMKTELGKVADLIQGVGQVITPLQQRLNRLGRVLAIASLGVVIGIFGFGLLLGEDWRLMFMTSVSMAVAVIPEGLPAVVTIALALGAQRMLRRRALIRRLPAVETLGSVTVICSDKTGTLTENRMTVTVLDVDGRRIDLTEESSHKEAKDEPSLSLLLMGGALCSDAVLQPDPDKPEELRAVGDPTEGALVMAAARQGLMQEQLSSALPRIKEVPFDSERKRMSTVHRVEDGSLLGEFSAIASGNAVVFTKGAVDSLLAVCSQVLEGGAPRPIDEAYRQRIMQANDEHASGGMRVLGVAYRVLANGQSLETEAAEAIERDLVFVGLLGLIDPPRPEVREAVATCRRAGIRPIMITGDHPVTARRIAQDLGILGEGKVIAGPELSGISPKELDELVDSVSVYARVAPEQKLRIVEALQRRGQVVAMTGDGVNDAPALRRADIGVAMGITGTDVSKEAASMVLLDDNFTTIVASVEEGRAINDNIRRFLKFSLAGNLGKLLLVFAAPMLGMPLPLSPFQILWLNLVTDGVLGLGIGVEPSERGVMSRPPQSPSESILSRGLGSQILWQGLLMGGINLAVAWWAWSTKQPEWQTIVLTTVVLLQVFQAQASRSTTESVFRLDPRTNKALLGATLALLILQAGAIYIGPLNGIFGTLPLSLYQALIPLGAGLVVLLVVELAKVLGRHSQTELRGGGSIVAES